MVPRRIAVTASMVGFSLFGDSMLYAVLPAEALHLGLGASAVGWILSANRWVRLLTNPLAGWVCARLGWRGPFLAAVLLGGLTTVGYGVLHSFWALLVARALWGLCWSFLRHGGFESVIESSPPDARGRNMGFLTGFFRMGSLFGMAAGGLLTDLIGYRPTLVLFGLATMAGLLVAAWDGWFSAGWPRHAPAQRTPGAASLRAAIRSPAWLGLSLCGLLLHGTTGGVITGTLGYYLRERLPGGLPVGGLLVGVATLSGILLSVRWAAGIGLNPLMGHLSDQVGRRRVMAMGTLLGSGGLAALGWAPSFWLLAGAVLLIWVAESAMAPTLDGSAADLAGRGGAEAMGLYASGMDLGAAVGPLAGYYLLQTGVELPYLYLFNAGLFLAVLLLYLTLVRPARRGEQTITSAKGV